MCHSRLSFHSPCLLLALAMPALSAGCTHNYYYTGTPNACPPMVSIPAASTSVVEYGAVCEVPSQSLAGTTLVPSIPSVSSGARPPRVVLSEPNGRPRLSWRRSDQESSLATTRVEGALDDPTLSR